MLIVISPNFGKCSSISIAKYWTRLWNCIIWPLQIIKIQLRFWFEPKRMPSVLTSWKKKVYCRWDIHYVFPLLRRVCERQDMIFIGKIILSSVYSSNIQSEPMVWTCHWYNKENIKVLGYFHVVLPHLTSVKLGSM